MRTTREQSSFLRPLTRTSLLSGRQRQSRLPRHHLHKVASIGRGLGVLHRQGGWGSFVPAILAINTMPSTSRSLKEKTEKTVGRREYGIFYARNFGKQLKYFQHHILERKSSSCAPYRGCIPWGETWLKGIQLLGV